MIAATGEAEQSSVLSWGGSRSGTVRVGLCSGESDLTAQSVWDSRGAVWRASKVVHNKPSESEAKEPWADQPVEGSPRAVESHFR